MLHNNYNSVMLIQAFEEYERCSSLKDYCYGLILALVGTQWPEALFNTHTWPLDHLCDAFPIFGPSEHQEHKRVLNK